MTANIIVPDGHKCCTRCGDVLPLATGFYVKKSTNPSTGTVSIYTEGRCKGCSNSYRPVKAAARREFKTHWPRHPKERECDQALMGWRNPGATVAQMVARI